MQKQRWLPKSPVKANTIDPASSRLLSKERKKYKQGLEKVQRLEFNARRQKKRADGKLREVQQESQTRIEEVAEALEECYEEKLEELRREKESMKKNIARLNVRSRREPLKILLKRSSDRITNADDL